MTSSTSDMIDLAADLIGSLWTVPPQRVAKMLGSGPSKYFTVLDTDGNDITLTYSHMRSHVIGAATYACPLIDANGLARALVGEIDQGGETAVIAALGAAATCGVTAFAFVYPPSGGHDGGHVWALYDQGHDPARLRAQAAAIVQAAGLPNDTEVYPCGKNIRLPFGYHRRSCTLGVLILQDGQRFDLDDPAQWGAGIAAVVALPRQQPEPPDPDPTDDLFNPPPPRVGRSKLPRRTLEYLTFDVPVDSRQRNIELYHAAQQFFAAGYSIDEARAKLLPCAHRDGEDDRKAEGTIASAYKSTKVTQPIGLSDTVDYTAPAPAATNGNGNGAPPIPPTTGAPAAGAAPRPAPAAPGTYHLTDLGNARRLADLFGASLRYVPAWGTWLIWDNTRWERDELGRIYLGARTVVQTIYNEAAIPGGAQQALARHAAASENRARIDAMVALAQTERGIAIDYRALDAQAMLLNVVNGTIDLRTGTLRPHDRADLLTKRVEIAYDPAAVCALWLAFLDRIFAGDAALIAYAQRLAGYCLTGDISEQCLFFLYGLGANGKTVFTRTLLRLLGGHGQQAPSDLILLRHGDAIPVDVARLVGARLVVVAEVEGGRRMAESKVKDLSGGDRLVARFMRQDLFEFEPTHKLLVYGNHKPVIRGSDTGIWRRLKLIPFTVTIPEDQRDKHFEDKLAAELPGILAWAVRGCLDWQQQGIGSCKAVRDATGAYRDEMDLLADFIDDKCVLGLDQHAGATELYTAYKDWCLFTGQTDVSQRAFGDMLTERGFGIDRDKKTRLKVRIGIGLKP